MILLQIKEQDGNPELHDDLNFKKRIVFSNEELCEKIRIFNDDLNDIAIEYIKVLLHNKTNQFVQYHDYDKESETLWFETVTDQVNLMAIDISVYLNIEKCCIQDKFDKKFKTINSSTYCNFIKIC